MCIRDRPCDDPDADFKEITFAVRDVNAHLVCRLCDGYYRDAQGRKRAIQFRFNVSVPRARVPEKASMLRDRSER